MSNAMRSGKRVLAGVAAGALALGTLSFVGATTASAKPSIKPKATATAASSAVRATGTGTSTLAIPPAKLTWAGTGLMQSPTSTIDLTTAPTGAATLSVWQSNGTTLDDTVTLAQNGTHTANAPYLIGDDTGVYFNVDTAGTYAGILFNGADTVSFSFTTAGAPTSLALTPATQTVLVGGVGTVNVALRDASGNITQPQTVDSVTVASNGDDTVAFPSLLGSIGGKLQFGTFDDTIQTQTAGSSTITATPLGTLPASGLTAQTATLIKTGTVSNVAIADLYVSTPADAINGGTIPTAVTAQVPENTTNVVVTVDDTTAATAGNRIRFKAVLSGGGTLNGAAATSAAPQYIDVTTDAKKQATLNLTLGGAAVLSGSTLTLTQVNVADGNVSNGGKITVSWNTPAVQPNSIVPTPRGNIVAKVGASTTVAVQVDDSFGTAMSGWTIRAYRGTGTPAPANLLSSGTTNAAGLGSVTVSPLSTTVNGGSETYRFTAQAPVNGTEITSAFNLVVTYTTSGEITTMSVTNSASASACSNTSCTLTTLPVVTVPSSGVVSGTASQATQAVSTTLISGTPTNMMTFTPNTTPDNAVVVTVPTGVKVSATNPASETTAWDGGGQTATVADNTPVYLWATKTGTHEVVFVSGGLTVTTKIHVVNAATDAYNIAVEAPATLRTGAFGTVTVKVTDAFGNPVTTATPAGSVKLNVAGQAVFGGFASTIATADTGADGSYTNNLVASQEVGAALITVTPAASNTASAWVTGYTKPTTFPAPVTSATATVAITNTADKSITITGSRTTVSGKPGIKIDGVVSGIEDGKTVIPYFRFPGETTFSQGSARPEITDSSFTWQRKTGKKFYAYVTSDDGVVKSNRVIIPAN